MWKEIVKDEIWTLDNFLPEDHVDKLLHFLNTEEFRTVGETLKKDKQIDASKKDGILAKTRSVADFAYNVHGNLKIREDWVVRDAVCQQLLKVDWVEQDDQDVLQYSDRNNKLYPLNLFTKSHGVGRRYSVHSEAYDTYGTFAFMIFLDEVEGCDLVFPSEKSLPALWEKYPLWKPIWEKNKETIPTSRYLDDFRYSPKRNQCILFKIESAHYVDEPQGEFIDKPGSWRHSIQGWPWVEPEFQKRMLNKISTYGDR